MLRSGWHFLFCGEIRGDASTEQLRMLATQVQLEHWTGEPQVLRLHD
jgi:hypothetical protein